MNRRRFLELLSVSAAGACTLDLAPDLRAGMPSPAQTVADALAFTAALPDDRGLATAADYQRADSLWDLTRNTVFKDKVHPHWLKGQQAFWYCNELADGKREYIFVDAAQGVRRPACNQFRLAQFLTKATGAPQDAERLDLHELAFSSDGAVLEFNAQGSGWRWDSDTDQLTKIGRVSKPAESQPPGDDPDNRWSPNNSDAPDGSFTAFIKDQQVWLRDNGSKAETELSRNGSQEDQYTGEIFWSPDSRKFVALKTVQGQKHTVYEVQSSPPDQVQPKLVQFDYLKPGDRIPLTRPHLFDAQRRKPILISEELFPNPWSVDEVHWWPDSSRFTFVYNQRGHRVMRVIAVDAQTGKAQAVVNEECKTFFDYDSKLFTWYLDKTGEMIWMSERDGWNHL